MKYTDLKIQTQRDFPNNARTQGFGWLVRAGFMTRENEPLPLGEQALARLQELSKDSSFLLNLHLPLLHNDTETYFPLSAGNIEVAHCQSCQYTERLELAQFKKTALPREGEKPLEKILTPDCHTIEALANFLGVPKEKTAKALMYTRLVDQRFVFVVVRGDMQLSDAKLKALVSDVRTATAEEIIGAGAVPGFASPIGLKKEALIVVDDLVLESQNLVAGANEDGYHLVNTNLPRDYSAELVADLVQAKSGDACPNCGAALTVSKANVLRTKNGFDFGNILLALAETHHDDKGLTLPISASPFDLYLMHVPGKTVNTLEKAEEIYSQLTSVGLSVLFDNRDERAGVKFNDADLIGCPMRVTVGEKALQNGMVELKPRKEKENQLVALDQLTSTLTAALK
ncbi:MAG TPA: YbaK/EbsC family protein [Anaerolineales bacterium]|nr:YbaK/EbsC family protein [Anaerolineales bacterium]HNN14003.1 YbaK/EbsC family protein [Anaerolineales bacterium]HNO30573.1 YbaK/EbsC family protein [Anaerolineales bacterium]